MNFVKSQRAGHFSTIGSDMKSVRLFPQPIPSTLLFFFFLTMIPSTFFGEALSDKPVDPARINAIVTAENKELTFEVTYVRPRFFSFGVEGTVEIRTGSSPLQQNQSKKLSLFSREGKLSIPFLVKPLGENWRHADVRVSIVYAGEDQEMSAWIPLTALLRTVHVHFLIPDRIDKNFQQSFRLITLSTHDLQPIRQGNVTVELQARDGENRAVVFEGPLNEYGTCRPIMDLHTFPVGEYQLHVHVETEGNLTSIQKKIQLENTIFITVSPDFPHCSIGQAIPINVSVQQELSREPVSKLPVILKVFTPTKQLYDSQELYTNESGTAEYLCKIGNTAKPGMYTIIAQSGQTKARCSISVKTNPENSASIIIQTDKEHYVFTDTVSCSIQLRRESGKPMAKQKLQIRLIRPERLARVYRTLWKTTDSKGRCSVSVNLEKLFQRRVLEEEPLPLAFEVSMASGNEETVRAQYPFYLYSTPQIIRMEPESGVLVKRLPTRFHLYGLNLSGRPLQKEYRVSDEKGEFEKVFSFDSAGFAVVDIPIRSFPLSITLKTMDGTEESRSFTFSQEDYSIYELSVLECLEIDANVDCLVVKSPSARGIIYVDFYAAGQLIETTATALESSTARFPIPEMVQAFRKNRAVEVIVRQNTPSKTAQKPFLSGYLVLNPLQRQEINRKEKCVSSVNNELFQLTLADEVAQSKYARLDLYGTNVPYDEFRHLLEKDPGTAPIFQHNQNYSPLLIQPEPVVSGIAPVENWRALYQDMIDNDGGKIWKSLPLSQKKQSVITNDLILKEKLLPRADLLDPWGNPYKVSIPGKAVESAGADGIWDTGDELIARGGWSLEKHVPAPKENRDGKAAIIVTVYDNRSMPLPQGDVSIFSATQKDKISVPSQPAKSQFFLQAIKPGNYNIHIESFGNQPLDLNNRELRANELLYIRVALSSQSARNETSSFPDFRMVAVENCGRIGNDQLNPLFDIIQYHSSVNLSTASLQDKNRVVLQAPQHWQTLVYRLSYLDQKNEYSHFWAGVEFQRELSITLPKLMISEIKEEKIVPFSITNNTKEYQKTHLSIKHGNWLQSSSKPDRDISVPPGKTLSYSYSCAATIPGEFTMDITLKNKGKTIERSIPWVINASQFVHTIDRFQAIKANEHFPMSFPLENNSHRLGALDVIVHQTPATLLYEMFSGKKEATTSSDVPLNLDDIIIELSLLYSLFPYTDDAGAEQLRDRITVRMSELYRDSLNFLSPIGGFFQEQNRPPDFLRTAYMVLLIEKLKDIIPVDPTMYKKGRYWILVNQQQNGNWPHLKTDESALLTSCLARLNTGLESIRRSLNSQQLQSAIKDEPLVRALLERTCELIDLDNNSSNWPMTTPHPGAGSLKAKLCELLILMTVPPEKRSIHSITTLIRGIENTTDSKMIAAEYFLTLGDYLHQYIPWHHSGHITISIGNTNHQLSSGNQLVTEEKFAIPEELLAKDNPVSVLIEFDGQGIPLILCKARYY